MISRIHGQVLREHGVGGAEVDRVFGAVDMDSSGRLHYMEFLAATVEARGFIEVCCKKAGWGEGMARTPRCSCTLDGLSALSYYGDLFR